jgi:hypothetical protein
MHVINIVHNSMTDKINLGLLVKSRNGSFFRLEKNPLGDCQCECDYIPVFNIAQTLTFNKDDI